MSQSPLEPFHLSGIPFLSPHLAGCYLALSGLHDLSNRDGSPLVPGEPLPTEVVFSINLRGGCGLGIQLPCNLGGCSCDACSVQ